MRNLVVADAVRETVDVLTPVRSGRSPLVILKLTCRGSRFTGQQGLLRGTTLADVHRRLAPRSTHVISVETLRICGILLQPFIPAKSVELLESLGTKPEERT